MSEIIAFKGPATKHQAGVDLDGLMQVLSKHLYSTPMVALRELVQNGHDSIVRRRLEDPQYLEKAGSIQVVGDPKNRTLHIIDSGAGLTKQEIHDFLATVGVGYTRTLRENDDETGLIGMFGLGFLSAFVLADDVYFKTTSYQTSDESWIYHSKNAQEYSVESTENSDIGTTITLTLKEEYEFIAHESVLQNILGKYCVLLQEPLYINAHQEAINQDPPPWRRLEGVILHPVQRLKQDLAFATKFERYFEPICTLPIEPNESSDAVGLLWVQDGATYGTSDNRNLSIFLRGMLLDDNARDLLPAWAGFIGGVIESHQLVPTASREDLQKDAKYDAIQWALSEAIILGLEKIAKYQPEAWQRIILRHNEALLGASLCDERLFLLLKDYLKVPTSQGDLLVKDLTTEKGMHVMLGGSGGFEEMLFRALQVPVALGDRYAVVPFLRKVGEYSRKPLIEIGTDKGNQYLFQAGKISEVAQEYLTTHLADQEDVIAAKFFPAELPLMIVVDRDAELKKRIEDDESNKKISQAALRLARMFTDTIEESNSLKLYINLQNESIQKLIKKIDAKEDVLPAIMLLKGVKTIMAGHDLQKNLDLNAALKSISTAVSDLMNDTRKG